MHTLTSEHWQGCTGLLSKRELEFTLHVAEGKTDKEIARAAGLAPDSVRKRIMSAMFKLGAHRRAQLVAEAMRRAIIAPLAIFMAICCVVVNSSPDNHQERAPRNPRGGLVRIKGGARRDDPFYNPFDYV